MSRARNESFDPATLRLCGLGLSLRIAKVRRGLQSEKWMKREELSTIAGEQKIWREEPKNP